MDSLNIVIMGVGGQGSLLASRLLGHIARAQGFDVKVSEVHGMSQRGGSVTTYVRMGKKVYGPLVEQKGADFILAMEELEALRSMPYLKTGGTLIMNTQKIMPLPVITGAAEYPAGIPETIAKTENCIAADALAMARAAGNARAVNMVLTGILASRLPFNKQVWLDAITAVVPERFMQANMAAFESGYQYGGAQQ